MLNLYNLRIKLRDFILPKVSYKIGNREKIAARISPENHYTINVEESEEFGSRLSCLKVENGKELKGSFFTGDTPKEGDALKLAIFIPGLTSGMNYGHHALPIRKVRNISKNLDEILVSQEDINWETR